MQRENHYSTLSNIVITIFFFQNFDEDSIDRSEDILYQCNIFSNYQTLAIEEKVFQRDINSEGNSVNELKSASDKYTLSSNRQETKILRSIALRRVQDTCRLHETNNREDMLSQFFNLREMNTTVYNCALCNKSFSQNSQMDEHLKTHRRSHFNAEYVGNHLFTITF